MSNATFVKGLVACAALMLAFGGIIAILNDGNNRPEGVAEDWLTAISDTTREGVEADATRRADAIGPPEFARNLLYPYAEEIDRKGGFVDLEVGKAVAVEARVLGALPAGEQVRVPFRVTARRPNDKTVERNGVITLDMVEDEWLITAVQVVDPQKLGLPELPSDGGPPPSSAPVTLWLGALVGAALIGVVSSALVRAAGRTTTAAAVA